MILDSPSSVNNNILREKPYTVMEYSFLHQPIQIDLKVTPLLFTTFVFSEEVFCLPFKIRKHFTNETIFTISVLILR